MDSHFTRAYAVQVARLVSVEREFMLGLAKAVMGVRPAGTGEEVR